jgi:chromosome segregation ATPase
MPSSSSGAPAAQHHPKTTHPTKPFIIDLSGNAKVSIPDASDKTLPTAAQPKIMNKSKENRILLGKCRNQFRTMISGLEEVKLRVMKAKGELDKEAGQLKNDIEVLNQKSKVVKEKQLEKVEKLDKLDEEISSLKDMHRQLEGELVNKLWK